MRQPIVLLACPSTCGDVIEAAEIPAPGSLGGNLEELTVLHHHRRYDWEKALVCWEDTGSTRHSVTLEESYLFVQSELRRTNKVGNLP